MRTGKALLLVLALLALATSLGACSTVRCATDKAKGAWQSACAAYQRSCEPCPGPPVTVDPVYDIDCGTGEAPQGHGAFAIPNPGK